MHCINFDLLFVRIQRQSNIFEYAAIDNHIAIIQFLCFIFVSTEQNLIHVIEFRDPIIFFLSLCYCLPITTSYVYHNMAIVKPSKRYFVRLWWILNTLYKKIAWKEILKTKHSVVLVRTCVGFYFVNELCKDK